MSKIAEALAKAKERTGTTTAPFLTGAHPPGGGVPLDPAKADKLSRARMRQRFWIILLSIATVLTALLIWKQLKEVRAEPDSSVAPPPPANPPSTGGDAPSRPTPPLPDPATPAPPLPPAEPAAPAVNPAAAPRAELHTLVNNLAITAVLPGEKPRLMYKGRIVNVGETVENDLVFAGIREGRLVFIDSRGAPYSRRY